MAAPPLTVKFSGLEWIHMLLNKMKIQDLRKRCTAAKLRVAVPRNIEQGPGMLRLVMVAQLLMLERVSLAIPFGDVSEPLGKRKAELCREVFTKYRTKEQLTELVTRLCT